MAEKTLYLVIQEGGSSVEAYPSLHDTAEAGLAAQRSHQQASYRATAPIPVKGVETAGVFHVDEDELVELIGKVRLAEYE